MWCIHVSHKEGRVGGSRDIVEGTSRVYSMRRDVWHLPGEGRDLAVCRLFSVLRLDFGHLIFACFQVAEGTDSTNIRLEKLKVVEIHPSKDENKLPRVGFAVHSSDSRLPSIPMR